MLLVELFARVSTAESFLAVEADWLRLRGALRGEVARWLPVAVGFEMGRSAGILCGILQGMGGGDAGAVRVFGIGFVLSSESLERGVEPAERGVVALLLDVPFM